MKKLLVLVAALFLSCNLFALEFKTYAAFDYNFCLGNTYVTPEGLSQVEFDTNRQGFDFDVAFYVFPVLGVYGNFANNFLLDNLGYDTAFKFDATFGIAYRQELAKNLELNIGVGPHISLLNYKNTAEDTTINTLGIGGTVGVRYVLFDMLYLNAGISGHYDFIPAGVRANEYDIELSEASVMDAKAYLGVGIIISEIF